MFTLIGTPVPLLIHAIIQSPHHLATVQCIQLCRYMMGGEGLRLVRSGKNDQTDLSCVKGYANINVHSLRLCWTKASQNAPRIEPWGAWATTAEDYIRFYSCRPGTGTWGHSGHRIPKTRLLKPGKTLPALVITFVQAWLSGYHKGQRKTTFITNNMQCCVMHLRS